MRKIFYLFGIITLLFTANIFAQTKIPPSQKQAISQNVGGTDITIVYHRPNAKGRVIFGELVPFDKVWRTGANNATTFEVSKNVLVGDEVLAAGKYSMHTIPGKDNWTIIFNKTSDQWGSFEYNEADDQLRIKAKPMLGQFHETMTIMFADVLETKANIVIAWDKTSVSFPIDTAQAPAAK